VEQDKSTPLATSSLTAPVNQDVLDLAKFGEVTFKLGLISVKIEPSYEDLSRKFFFLDFLEVLFGKKFLDAELFKIKILKNHLKMAKRD
jgi:DNA polymerase sigma